MEPEGTRLLAHLPVWDFRGLTCLSVGSGLGVEMPLEWCVWASVLDLDFAPAVSQKKITSKLIQQAFPVKYMMKWEGWNTYLQCRWLWQQAGSCCCSMLRTKGVRSSCLCVFWLPSFLRLTAVPAEQSHYGTYCLCRCFYISISCRTSLNKGIFVFEKFYLKEKNVYNLNFLLK